MPNFKFINIPESLSDYGERLFFERDRYSDILKTVDRKYQHLSDEEWENSWNYYNNKYDESSVAVDAFIEFLREEYNLNTIDEWWLDFNISSIVIGKLSQYHKKYKEENYNDYIGRIYREYDTGEDISIDINSFRCKNITIQVTEDCNMACTYCYQHNKRTNSMSFDIAKQFIDILIRSNDICNSYIDLNKINGIVFDFIGGEPLLQIDLISEISEYIITELFRRKHPLLLTFMFSICSNGLLYFNPRVQSYLKRHEGHTSFSISIDGNKDLHDACRIDKNGNGTYDRAIKAANHYMSNYNNELGSKMTIAPGNVDKVAIAVESMIEHGYKTIHLNCVYEEGWELNHASILYNQLVELTDYLSDRNLINQIYLSILDNDAGYERPSSELQNWCGGTGLMLAVDYKGDMFPCLRYMENSIGTKQESFVIGNLEYGINNDPIHKKRVECLRCIDRRTQSTDECFNCPIATGCGWCSAYHYEIYGTPNKRATFICDMHKARCLAMVYHNYKKGTPIKMNCPKEWAIPIIGEEEYNKLLAMQS